MNYSFSSLQRVAFLDLILLFSGATAFSQNKEHKTALINGTSFTDNEGKVINAHGGGFLKVSNYYYWIGENRNKALCVLLSVERFNELGVQRRFTDSSIALRT